MADTPADAAPPAKPAPLELMERWSNGEPLQAIADELGCHPSTLYKQMLRAGGPEAYYEAKVAANQMRVYQADELLERATNALEFNKAHARAKLVRQDYAYTCPKEYGPKHEVSVDTSVNIYVNRMPQHIDTEPRTIDGQGQVIDNTQ